MGSLIKELKRAGLEFRGVSDWSVLVRMGKQTRDTIISITPRAPDVPDLYVLDASRSRHAPGKDLDGVLIHTMRSVPDDHQELLVWAVGARNLALVPEDQVVQFVDSL